MRNRCPLLLGESVDRFLHLVASLYYMHNICLWVPTIFFPFCYFYFFLAVCISFLAGTLLSGVKVIRKIVYVIREKLVAIEGVGDKVDRCHGGYSLATRYCERGVRIE